LITATWDTLLVQRSRHPLSHAASRPAQRTRLIEIIRSLSERIAEAKLNGWLGEEEGLRITARYKLTGMDRIRIQRVTRIVGLGVVQIRNREGTS
jgi:hypothetical protein